MKELTHDVVVSFSWVFLGVSRVLQGFCGFCQGFVNVLSRVFLGVSKVVHGLFWWEDKTSI